MEHGVVPAVKLDLPVSTTGDFAATGKRVDADKATGTVRFDSINTVGPVFVPAGTRTRRSERRSSRRSAG